MTFVQTGTYLKPSLARGNQMEGGFFLLSQKQISQVVCKTRHPQCSMFSVLNVKLLTVT